MGGCKCSFQDCTMTTGVSKKQFPDRKTHFFHFPVKDPDRCVKWCIYSNNMSYLDLSADKLKNKVICDFHFEETHFMNHKREKLNKTSSFPTIYITKDMEEVDLLTSPTSWIETNQRLPINHTGFTSMKIDMDDMNDSEPESFPTPAKKQKVEILSSQPVKILNINASSSNPVSFETHKLPTRTIISAGPKKIPPTKPLNQNLNYTIRTISRPPTKREETQHVQVFEMNSDDIEDKDLPMVIFENETQEMKEIVTAPVEDLKQEVEDLKPLLMESLKASAEIKELLKTSAATTPQDKPKLNEGSGISHSNFNKVQLFNGIKRYLSPSMIALLRMELFAAPTREYKTDEKIICTEILQLGSETYNFLTDEWRLRLPAVDNVREWMKEKELAEDDDAS